MKASLIQFNVQSDLDANLATIARLTARAVQQDAPDLIVLPEVFHWMGGDKRAKQENAETLPDGKIYAFIQNLSKTHRVWFHAGSLREKVPNTEKRYNTTVVFDRDGKEIARYRKIHLFDVQGTDGNTYRESDDFMRGDAIVTYECEGLTIGCAICYDLRFPELFQELMKKDADVIVLPAAFTFHTGDAHWQTLCRARAIETQTYFLACGQVGAYDVANGRAFTYGHSLIADPWGIVIAEASEGEDVVSAYLDRERIRAVRARVPVRENKIVSPA